MEKLACHESVMVEGLTPEESFIFNWQYYRFGGFLTRLVKVLLAADSDNFERLRKGFPVECRALEYFWNEKDWWSNVQKKITELGLLS